VLPGNVVLTDAAAKPAVVVMSMQRYNALLHELEAATPGGN
jgi:hypothetical protein